MSEIEKLAVIWVTINDEYKPLYAEVNSDLYWDLPDALREKEHAARIAHVKKLDAAEQQILTADNPKQSDLEILIEEWSVAVKEHQRMCDVCSSYRFWDYPPEEGEKLRIAFENRNLMEEKLLEACRKIK